MSKKTKRVEKIEKEAKQDMKEVKPTELPEQDLDKVAGGSTFVLGNKTGGGNQL